MGSDADAQSERSDRTRLLLRASKGDREAQDALLPEVYDALRSMAGRRMAGERADHTLQPTALVHEAYLRLFGKEPLSWKDRGHFYATAALAMRRILVEHARARAREKRGGGRRRLPASLLDLAASDDLRCGARGCAPAGGV